jgi:dTDP-4-amino-4,6-dideoxygalactose transaminase
LQENGILQLPNIPTYATNNAHMFYVVCKNLEHRTSLIETLKKEKIHAVFHYLSFHKSHFYQTKHDGRELPQTDFYSDTLVRLPMYYELEEEEVNRIVSVIGKQQTTHA